MPREIIRKNITLLNKEQLKKYEKFAKDAGYSSFSSMCRDLINKSRKDFYSKKSDEMGKTEEILSYLQDILKKVTIINERDELIEIRINREGINSNVGHAIRDIIHLLNQKDLDHSEILSKCKKFDDKTLDAALSILVDADIIGTEAKTRKR